MNYLVQVEDYAEKHFIKRFQKKYKARWDLTLRAIVAELERIDTLLLTDKADSICKTNEIQIIKTSFKVVKTKESTKSSGCRCIVAWKESEQLVSILLVYHKTDLGGNNETVEWKNIIKEHYYEYGHLF